MQSKYQKGSAEVIALIVLVIALVGGLGYVFWKNNHKDDMKKTDTTSTTQQSTTKANELANTAELKLSGRTLAFNYPEGWKLANVSAKDPNEGKTITSPTGNYVVTIQLLDQGLGGACGEGGPFITSKTTDLSNGTGEFLFEYTGTSQANGDTEYIAQAKVEPNTVSKGDLAVGKNVCNVSLGYFAANGGSDLAKDGVVAIAQMDPGTDGTGFFSTKASADKWMQTDEYKSGTKILLSLQDK